MVGPVCLQLSFLINIFIIPLQQFLIESMSFITMDPLKKFSTNPRFLILLTLKKFIKNPSLLTLQTFVKNHKKFHVFQNHGTMKKRLKYLQFWPNGLYKIMFKIRKNLRFESDGPQENFHYPLFFRFSGLRSLI